MASGPIPFQRRGLSHPRALFPAFGALSPARSAPQDGGMRAALCALLSVMFLTPGPATAEAAQPHCPAPVLVTDATGAEVEGSKQGLLAALQAGQAVQVGFRLSDQTTDGFYLTHWINPAEFSQMGDDLFTRASKVHLQLPEDADLSLGLPADSEIAVPLIGTDGLVYFRRTDDKALTIEPVTAWWCTDG